ncbi:MAG: exonuclease domain-containing protein [Chlamydiota bacterium]|jgi:DNA polymerase-3 subunit epsilon
MGLLHKDTFICLDCETTGLDTKNDRIIEVAAVRFTFDKIIDQFETLVNPRCAISESSQLIHHISDEMVQGKPAIDEVLPKLIDFVGDTIIVGHGIMFDIDIISEEAKKHTIFSPIKKCPIIDTLRLARLYGQSPVNSLEKLREHFNIKYEGAHRAMSDVIVNVEVFKKLSSGFKTTEELMQRLKKPIVLRTMPLGKHKGRTFNEIPLDYLIRSLKRDFDEDLSYTIRKEIKNRKRGQNFHQAANPFQNL